MNKLVFALPLISIIITFLIGIFIYLRDTDKKLNKHFFYMALFLSLWMLANFLEDVEFFSSFSEVFVKLDFFFAPLAAFFFYLFTQLLPAENWRSLGERIIVFIITVVLSISPFLEQILIKSVFFENGSVIQFSPMIWLYGAMLTIILFGSCLVILDNMLKSKQLEEKKQLFFLLIGFLLLTISVVVSNLLLPNLVTNIPLISRLGYIGVIAFITLCSYAILKHHLFDVRVILTEIAAAMVVLVLVLQTILSETSSQFIINTIITILVSYGGYLIIKSVQNEIRQKEKLQELTTQLAQANSHLQELDKMKTEFVSLASHELLTPVSAIEGYLSMLLDEKLAKVDDPKAVKYLDNVYKSAKRLARLVSDLLNISRIEEGRLLVEKSDVDLDELIKQVIDELKFKADEHKQKIVFADNNDYATFGDGDKIKEVLVNLIGNSIKYSRDPGTISVEVVKVPTAKIEETWGRVESDIKNRPLDDQESIKSAVDEHLRGLVGNEQYLIAVKDQGVGIPPEELPRLFKKFHRVGNFSTQESQGTGLGLYISRALVELNHGRIWADSEGMGKGSTFSFSLPLIDSKPEILKLEAQAPQPEEQLKPLSHPSKVAEDI